jgi:hypothetical protein
MNRHTVRHSALLGSALAFTLSASAQSTPPASTAAKPDASLAITNSVVGSNPNDPRANLKAGLFDAGETAMSMQHVGFLKKPAAFTITNSDPDSPEVQKTLDMLGAGNAKIPKNMRPVVAQLAFANSDFAFQGTTLFQGNFYGINFYDISNPHNITLLTSLVCPGGQGDVSVYGNLLFMSVEMPNGRIDCGTQGFPAPPAPKEAEKPADTAKPADAKSESARADAVESAQGKTNPEAKPKTEEEMEAEARAHRPAPNPERFRGVRIFDISDIHNPKQVAAIQTCRGSHTHTLVSDPNDKDNIYVYVSGTSFVRQPEELAGCSDEKPNKDPNTALFRIDVIKVPLAAPQNAAIVSSPRVFIDPRTGALNGLNNGGAHGKSPDAPMEKVADTNQCHDITAYPAIGLAAGACSGNGLLLDIHDPVHPKRIDAVNDPNYSYWHSATFSNDGKKVVFTDEWGGGMQPRCRPTDPLKWGADAIFDLDADKLKFANYYKMPAAQGASENCVAHNGSLVPIPGRDVEVQAWYQGGISVVDFTNPMHPVEIGYFDRGAIDPKNLVLGGDWSAYWYNGYVYGSEIARGLDVFQLTPGKYLTQNEIDAANQVHLAQLNVQSQQPITWPNTLLTARAYVDQLTRSQALPADQIGKLKRAMEDADKHHLDAKHTSQLADMANQVETAAGSAKDAADAKRLHALATILRNPAA